MLLARLSGGAGYEDGSDVTNFASEPVPSGYATAPFVVVPESIRGTITHIVITARVVTFQTEQSGSFSPSIIRYRVGEQDWDEYIVDDWPADSPTTQVSPNITETLYDGTWTEALVNALTIDAGAYFNPDFPGDAGGVIVYELYVDVYGEPEPEPDSYPYGCSYLFPEIYHYGWFNP